MKEIEASISRYRATSTPSRNPYKVRTERLQDKIAALKEQMNSRDRGPTKRRRINRFPTDPDARSMKTRGTGIVG
ncbi:MAG: hypothetical protein IPP84_11125 [Propionivibrio sp.]|nr:hypothetical protein [Propionivibrio sp.]